MLNRKEERELFNLDLIILILSIIGLFSYTTLFVYTNSNIRYIFLVFVVYAAAVLTSSVKDIALYYKVKKIKRNNMCRVNLKLFNNRRRRVKKVI